MNTAAHDALTGLPINPPNSLDRTAPEPVAPVTLSDAGTTVPGIAAGLPTVPANETEPSPYGTQQGGTRMASDPNVIGPEMPFVVAPGMGGGSVPAANVPPGCTPGAPNYGSTGGEGSLYTTGPTITQQGN